MQVGTITVDGRQIGIVTIAFETPDTTAPLLSGDDMPMRGDGGGDSLRLGHHHGYYPGARQERHGIRLGHKHGFHQKDPEPEPEQHGLRLGHKRGFYPKTGEEGGGKAVEGASLEGVDKRLVEIAKAGAKHLPEGYTIKPTSGVRHAGQGYHTVGKASDWQIYTPEGIPLSNRGSDPTGLYKRWARGAYGYALQKYPDLARNQLAWGGAFETSAGSGTRDIMHLDLGGERGNLSPESRLSRMGPLASRPSGSVRGSWFDDPSTATGLSAATTPGIALPTREGLGKMHEVTGPNGQTVLLPQIDVGPAAWTGRGIDISKAALEKLGYTAKNFPTDAFFSHRRIDPSKAKAEDKPFDPETMAP
jgi:hypothetical protein